MQAHSLTSAHALRAVWSAKDPSSAAAPLRLLAMRTSGAALGVLPPILQLFRTRITV